VQIPSPEINLDLGTTIQQPFAPSSASSTPNRDKDKYPVDDTNDPTPCALIYLKGRTSSTIKVAEGTVMPSRIHHGRPVPVECAVVEVTTIREGCEFEDLDYPDEDEGIEKLIYSKGTFILWPRKDIIVKTRSSPIISPWSTEVGSTPTLNMPKSAQISHPSVTPPLTQNAQDPAKESQVPELQDNREHRPPSPARDPELQESMGRRPLSAVKKSQGPELQGNMERMSPSPTRDYELQGKKECMLPSPAQDQELQGNMKLRPPSPPAQVPELQDTKGKRLGSPPAKDKDL
jgi:hypothetical protein